MIDPLLTHDLNRVLHQERRRTPAHRTFRDTPTRRSPVETLTTLR